MFELSSEKKINNMYMQWVYNQLDGQHVTTRSPEKAFRQNVEDVSPYRDYELLVDDLRTLANVITSMDKYPPSPVYANDNGPVDLDSPVIDSDERLRRIYAKLTNRVELAGIYFEAKSRNNRVESQFIDTYKEELGTFPRMFYSEDGGNLSPEKRSENISNMADTLDTMQLILGKIDGSYDSQYGTGRAFTWGWQSNNNAYNNFYDRMSSEEPLSLDVEHLSRTYRDLATLKECWNLESAPRSVGPKDDAKDKILDRTVEVVKKADEMYAVNGVGNSFGNLSHGYTDKEIKTAIKDFLGDNNRSFDVGFSVQETLNNFCERLASDIDKVQARHLTESRPYVKENIEIQEFYNRYNDVTEDDITDDEIEDLSTDLHKLTDYQRKGLIDKCPPNPVKGRKGNDRLSDIYNNIAIQVVKTQMKHYKELTSHKFSQDDVYEAVKIVHDSLMLGKPELTKAYAKTVDDMTPTAKVTVKPIGFGIDFSKSKETIDVKQTERQTEKQIQKQAEKANTQYYHPREGYSNTIGEMDENGDIKDDGYSFDERDERGHEFDDIIDNGSYESGGKAFGED